MSESVILRKRQRHIFLKGRPEPHSPKDRFHEPAVQVEIELPTRENIHSTGNQKSSALNTNRDLPLGYGDP
jgi:hypothetical protein